MRGIAPRPLIFAIVQLDRTMQTSASSGVRCRFIAKSGLVRQTDVMASEKLSTLCHEPADAARFHAPHTQ